MRPRPQAPSLISRFVRATVTVAVASALLLAGAASLIAWTLWEAGEKRDLEQGANALATKFESDARDRDWSWMLAAPLCFGLALVAGRAVAVRAAQPLLDLNARIKAARPPEPFAPPTCEESVAEVGEIERAFGGLWTRLVEALSRERDFAANASHELRTPLTRIRLYGERAAAAAGAQAMPELDEQRREIDRMVRLVDSLLVLARDVSRGADEETVNLADVLRDCTRRVFPEASEAEISAPDEALVQGDEDLLRISALNLLDNARKFKQPGSRARMDLEESAGLVRVGISSPGARVAAAERDRVFERFYRSAEARAAHDGHGLGLALVRHIARLHGGEAWCASGPDEDARFVLGIPSWPNRNATTAESAGLDPV